ncbi:hypothetical protein ACYCFK_14415 [Stutzerimonas stutzeri]
MIDDKLLPATLLDYAAHETPFYKSRASVACWWSKPVFVGADLSANFAWSRSHSAAHTANCDMAFTHWQAVEAKTNNLTT